MRKYILFFFACAGLVSVASASNKKLGMRSPANNATQTGGQGCYLGASSEVDGTYCVYGGMGPDGSSCRRIVPLNQDVAKVLEKSSSTDKEICLYGSSVSSPAKSSDAGLYFIYRAESQN